MAAPRAYQLIKIGKSELPNPFNNETIKQGKLHPLIAYEVTKGFRLPSITYPKPMPSFRVDIYWLVGDEVFSDHGFITNSEENITKYLDKQKERLKNGIPKKGRKVKVVEK